MSYTVLKRDITNVVIITFVLLWFYENVYTHRNNNHVGLYYLKLICVYKINDIFLDKLLLQGMMWIKIAVLIMHVWFTLSQEYALPLNYIITPPGGFLWKQELTIISSQHRLLLCSIFLVWKDLSSCLSFPDVTLSFTDMPHDTDYRYPIRILAGFLSDTAVLRFDPDFNQIYG